MSECWKQERPTWCPHADCAFKRRAMDNACVGDLPAPAEHDGDYNYHRLCINGALPNGEIFDLQINRTDISWFLWLMKGIAPDVKPIKET